MAPFIITLSNITPTMSDVFTVDVKDGFSGFTEMTAMFKIHTSCGDRYRVFRCEPISPLAPDYLWRATIRGWQLGAFAPCSVDIVIMTNRNDVDTTKTLNIPSMTVIETSDPFGPIIDFFVQWLQSDPVISTFGKSFKKVKKAKDFLPRVPGFYVYADNFTTMGMVGTTDLRYRITLTIAFLEGIRSRREVDVDHHAIFAKRVCEYVANNSQLDPSFNVVVAKPKAGRIPFNSFESIFGVMSKVEIDIEVTPKYP